MKKRVILVLSFLIQAAIVFEVSVAGTVTKGSGSTSATVGLEVTNSSNTSLLYIRNDGKVGINNTNPGSALDVKGGVRLSGATSGYFGLAPANTPGHVTYTLPAADGTSGQILNTDSSGTLTWVTPASNDFVKTHTAGSWAPITTTITYRTVTTDIGGTGNHTWILQNLGADAPASGLEDYDAGFDGWYWQFNRTQGYKHDGNTRTPSSAWNSSNDNTYTGWDPAKDPCTELLGTGWRLPTYSELSNIASNFSGYTPLYSVLKLHDGSYLEWYNGDVKSAAGSPNWWSSTQVDVNNGYPLRCASSSCNNSGGAKAYGALVRCLK